MARTTDELLTALKGFLPVEYHQLLPLLAGEAAAMSSAESGVESMGLATFLDQAEGTDLDLHGRGLRVRRRTGESEESYRARLRRPQDAVTPQAILTAVNAVLAEYGAQPAMLVEWFDAPYLDHDFYDHVPYSHGWHGFVVVIPQLGEIGWGDDYLDHSFLDHSFFGVDEDHPSVAAVAAEVYRLKAAGVQAAVLVADLLP